MEFSFLQSVGGVDGMGERNSLAGEVASLEVTGFNEEKVCSTAKPRLPGGSSSNL